MPGMHYKSAGPWENKFRTPSAADLMGALPRAVSQLLEIARQRLRELPGVREDIAWQGLPWRWTFAYRTEGETRAWAYIVPDPAKPRVVLPMTLDVLAKLPVRKLTKTARDPISHGVEVDGVHWVEWEITGRPLLDEVLALASARMNGSVPAHG